LRSPPNPAPPPVDCAALVHPTMSRGRNSDQGRLGARLGGQVEDAHGGLIVCSIQTFLGYAKASPLIHQAPHLSLAEMMTKARRQI